MKKPVIEIKNTSIIKSNHKLLDNISLTINEGENTAIVGPNGSGKTTLLKIITRDLYPSLIDNVESYVKVFGNSSWDLFELRSKIGIISNSLQSIYNKNCKGIEVVLSGFFGSIGIYSTHKISLAMKLKANRIMDFLEIAHLKNRILDEMSSGEFNRFLVGRSLVNNPDILILDEPTTNLDIKATNVFLHYIQKIAKTGKTVIMVTHQIHDIIPEINRIILIKHGRIFKDGNKEEIINSKNFKQLFDYNIKIKKINGSYAFW